MLQEYGLVDYLGWSSDFQGFETMTPIVWSYLAIEGDTPSQETECSEVLEVYFPSKSQVQC